MSNFKNLHGELLADKVALITGASQGIGASIAELFAIQGASVYLCSRNAEKLGSLASELEQYNVDITTFIVDLTDETAIKEIFRKVAGKGNLDILVNNAGIMNVRPLSFIKTEDIQSHFEINTFAAIRCCQLSARLMIRNGSGSIINIGSMLGEYGQQGQSVYAASKAAISGLTLSLAQELAAYKIRVNALAPGIIDTALTQQLDEMEKNKTVNRIALKRMGLPEEVAKSCLYLASDLSSYVTGQIIGVDGGIHF